MYQSLFKKEFIVNGLVLCVGIVMNVLAIFIDNSMNNAVSIMLMGIGCSLIASSFVTFMSFMISERIIDINEQAKKIGLQSVGEKADDFFVKKLQKAKYEVDIVNGDGEFPIKLLREQENIFAKILSKGVSVNILVYEETHLGYEEELEQERVENYFKGIVENLRKKGLISLTCIYTNIGCKWIRIDETIYQFVENSLNAEKSLIYEFKRIDSKDSPFNALYSNYLKFKENGKQLV